METARKIEINTVVVIVVERRTEQKVHVDFINRIKLDRWWETALGRGHSEPRGVRERYPGRPRAVPNPVWIVGDEGEGELARERWKQRSCSHRTKRWGNIMAVSEKNEIGD